MRLIDADKILYFKGKDIVGEDAYITQKDVIDEMPTVDAEPVIRCKDCSFWGTEQDGYCAAIDDPYMLETDADDFCSWGEKR